MKNELESRSYCVYMHISPSKKVYIGITSQEPHRRWSNGNGYKDSPAFWKAIQKYGWANIEHRILFEKLAKDEAEKLEIEKIKEFCATDKKYGYNIENGGNCVGTHSEETKRKISEKNKGKIVSEETRKKLSEAQKGKHVGKNNPFYGKHHTKETREKHSRFMSGNSYNKGNHHSENFKKMKSAQMKEKYKDGGNPRCKKVVFTQGEDKTIFFSLREAARISKINLATLHKYVHDNSNKNWGYLYE